MLAKSLSCSDGQRSFIWLLIGSFKQPCCEKNRAELFRECNTLRRSDPHSNCEVGSSKPVSFCQAREEEAASFDPAQHKDNSCKSNTNDTQKQGENQSPKQLTVTREHPNTTNQGSCSLSNLEKKF